MPPLPPGLGNLGGAFDLGSLRKPAVSVNPDDLGYVVTQENLIAELLPASHDAVAILLCWSPRSAQAQALIPVMRQFNRDDETADGEPTWIFGTVNVDAEPAVAKALQVQSVPLAIAVIQEQLVPLFESVPPADQVRAVINKVIELAAQKGVGIAPTSEVDAEPAVEPEEAQAMAALESGDLTSAKATYQEWINRSPGNQMAKIGLAQVELLIRIDGLDLLQVCAQADQVPRDIDLAMKAADCEMAQGDFEMAANRMISAIKGSSGDERKRVRDHLLALFELVESDHPYLPKARQQLASALF